MAEPRYLLIDRRFNRLCEFWHEPHGETSDLFWLDVTDRPEVTLEWVWRDDALSPPEPEPAPQPAEIVDYGPQTYRFDAGKGLAEHQHPFAHDHVVKKGRTFIVVAAETFYINEGERWVAPANMPHSITAMENGTEFVNTRIS